MTTTTTARPAAADFSDLFASFGNVSSANAGAGTKGTGGAKLTMAQLAEKTRQEQLFGGSASGTGKGGVQQNKSGGGLDSFDSLI